MSVAEKTCRTCGKAYMLEHEKSLCSIYNSTEYENEIKMVLEEFDIWNLEISENDGLPQKICLTCFDSFCQIHNFRLMCIKAQLNFSEMCTGLDIIIKDDIPDEYEYDNKEICQQLIYVQERYTFPGDENIKTTSNTSNKQLIDREIGENQPDAVEDESHDNNETNGEGDTQVERTQKGDDEEQEYVLDLKDHRCEYCMGFVSFDDPDDLNRHYNELHSTDLPYNCPKCELRFDKKVKRNSHVRCHFDTQPISCNVCGKKFRGDKEMLAQHIAYYHTTKSRECKVCHLKFDDITLLKYDYHMKWHNDSELVKCKFCEKKFIQLPHLYAHEKTHANEADFVCSDCGLGLKTELLYKKHRLQHERNELVQCPKCPKSRKKYFSLTGINLHDQKTHAPNKKPNVCEICDKTFLYLFDLKVHNHKKHNGPAPKTAKRPARAAINDMLSLRRRKRRAKRVNIKPFKCEKCDERFVLELQLKRHVKIHDEHRPYPCEYCPKKFKRDAHLKLHVNNIHLHKRPYKCTQCKAAFVQRSHLGDHIRVIHENQKNHECDVCHKKFGTPATLKIHKIIHSDERPFPCELCGASFKQMAVLKSHMSYIHLWKSEEAERRKEHEMKKIKNIYGGTVSDDSGDNDENEKQNSTLS